MAESAQYFRDQEEGRSVSGMVEQAYNNLRDRALSGAWKGMWEMAGSGFGKGLVYTAGGVIAITALAFAGQAAISGMADMARVNDGHYVVKGLTSVLNGLGVGAVKGLAVLGHPVSWSLMGAGAATGAFLAQGNETADLAEARARAAGREREKGQVKEPEIAPVTPEKKPEPSQDIKSHPMYDEQLDGPAAAAKPPGTPPSPASPSGSAAERPVSAPSNDNAARNTARDTDIPASAPTATFVSYAGGNGVTPPQPVPPSQAQPLAATPAAASAAPAADADHVVVTTTVSIPTGFLTREMERREHKREAQARSAEFGQGVAYV